MGIAELNFEADRLGIGEKRNQTTAVPGTYTTNVDDSPYVEEPFQDSGSCYAPSEEYGSDSTSDAMEKAPYEEQESSRI
ncbi:hypothetical protein FQA39_LY04978 [Lamprigera yunnana]|nr:hypothetical protein FQA39_LY04978 [Lamprigera yunnana]